MGKSTVFSLNIYFILALLIANLLLSGLVGANQASYADCMRNPFASGCRGISAKRSQVPAIQALQADNARTGDTMLGSHYRHGGVISPAKQWPPLAELMIAQQWLISECALGRYPSLVDFYKFCQNPQQQNAIE